MKRLLALYMILIVALTSVYAPVKVFAEPLDGIEEDLGDDENPGNIEDLDEEDLEDEGNPGGEETPEGNPGDEGTPENAEGIEDGEIPGGLGAIPPAGAPMGNGAEDITVEDSYIVEIPAIIPDTEYFDSDVLDSEEAFKNYAESIFYQDFMSGISLFSTGSYTAGSRLTGATKKAYDEIAQMIKDPSKITSTEFALSSAVTDATGMVGRSYTYSELDVTYTGGSNLEAWVALNSKAVIDKASDKAKADSSSIQKIDEKSLINALLFDYPYELYWFDKTSGVKSCYYTRCGFSKTGVTISRCDISFTFLAAQEYADSSGSTYDPTKLNTSKTTAAVTAYNNAKSVVSAAASKGTKAKLDHYLDYIKGATSYNSSAANNSSYPYGDPWQLIWVFDGNSTTTVVCEGYAKAFQLLCDLTNWGSDNVQCYTVTGTMSGGTGAGGHMWNVVSINGKSYLVDVTNCDEDTIGAGNKLYLKGAATSYPTVSFNLGSTITYTYDDETKSTWSSDELTLHTSDYSESNDANAIKGSLSLSNHYKVGETITATPSISNTGSHTPGYKWYASDAPTTVLGSSNTLPITVAMVGKTIVCEVTASGLTGSLKAATAKTIEYGNATSNANGVTAGVRKLLNTNSNMEYSINRNFSPATSITGTQVTGLTPGTTYYVRVRASGGNAASAYKAVTLPYVYAIPTAVSGLKYNGNTQTGVRSGSGYTVSGNTGKNAGSYTAIAKLSNTANSVWDNGSDSGTNANQSISWSIAKTTGLTGVPRTLTHIYSDSGSKTFDLKNILPSILVTGGDSVTYSVGTKSDSNNIINGNPTGSGSTLTYAVRTGLTSANSNNTATIPVTVSGSNFNSFTVNITVKIASKNTINGLTPPTITAAFGTQIKNLRLSKTSDTGRGLSNASISGTWALASEEQAKTTILPVGTSTPVMVTFTPSSSANKNSYENYTVPVTPTITKKTLTVSITGGPVSKTYDGNKTVTSSLALSVSGKVSGFENVSASAESFEYDTANAGTKKTVTAKNVTLSGTDASNYALPSGAITLSGNTITPKARDIITISGNHSNNGKTYTYVVNSISGAIYWMDSSEPGSGNNSSNIFARILPGTTHTFYARIPASADGNIAASNTDSIKVTFPKLDTPAPNISYTVSRAQDGKKTVTFLAPVDGRAEYSFDNGLTWSANPRKSDITDATLTIKARLKADDHYNVSPESVTTVDFSKSTIGVNGGFAFLAGNPVNQANANETISIESNVPEGYKFTKWTITPDTVKLDSATSSKTTFKMPETLVDIVVTANFEAISYAVTVKNGTANPKSATMGTKVSITADSPARGKVFDNWTVVSGPEDFSVSDIENPSSATTSFKMPIGAVELQANYKDSSSGGSNSGGSGGSGSGGSPSGGGSGSGGNNNTGGSGGGGNANATPPATGGGSSSGATISGSSSSAITVSVSGGNATVTIAPSTISQIANSTSGNTNETAITLDISKLPAAVNTITIPANTLNAIASAVNDRSNNKNTVDIVLPKATVTMDPVVVNAVSSQSGNQAVQVVVKEISSTASNLNQAQKTAVANLKPALITDVYFQAGNKRITDINNGTMQVSHTKFKAASGKDMKYYHVVYIDDSGKTSPRNTWVTSEGLAFETYHNSIYAVVYDESYENASGSPVYRIYNPTNGDHVMTPSLSEKTNAVSFGWKDEGIYFNSSTAADATPVYRVYNPNTGEHFYTVSVEERDSLVKIGWKNEGMIFKVKGKQDVYRLYNPGPNGYHHFTMSAEERDALTEKGWRYEGIIWTA